MIIAARVNDVREAADMFRSAAAVAPACAQPAIGHPGADAALGEFSTTMAGYCAALADAARHASVALGGRADAFVRADS